MTSARTTPRKHHQALRVLRVGAALAVAAGAFALPSHATATTVDDPPTPGVTCTGSTDQPETVQGRVPLADVQGGRAALGYNCNADKVSHFGATGGYRVARYNDGTHECAYYDTTLLFPKDTITAGTESTGTYVLDMTHVDATHPPVHTDTLRTPAFQSPHESVRLNQARGLLVADMGYPTWNPGFVDVFSVKEDCTHPKLMSSTPLGLLGHESGFSPDGNTFYVSSLYAHTISAVDLTDPTLPKIAWASTDYSAHGMSVSDDGNRLYIAESAFEPQFGPSGLTILDVSQVQQRVLNPTVTVVSRLSWPHMGTPQNAMPFTEAGHPYLAEVDEFGSGDNIGAARIIDIADETHPAVVSLMRLAVQSKDAQADPGQGADPGAQGHFQGYRGHYCEIPDRVDPKIVACTFIMSGLRIFNIEDVKNPLEVAYFNAPVTSVGIENVGAGNFAMAAPAFAPDRNEVWYTDGNSGFYDVHLTGAAKYNPAGS